MLRLDVEWESRTSDRYRQTRTIVEVAPQRTGQGQIVNVRPKNSFTVLHYTSYTVHPAAVHFLLDTHSRHSSSSLPSPSHHILIRNHFPSSCCPCMCSAVSFCRFSVSFFASCMSPLSALTYSPGRPSALEFCLNAISQGTTHTAASLLLANSPFQ